MSAHALHCQRYRITHENTLLTSVTVPSLVHNLKSVQESFSRPPTKLLFLIDPLGGGCSIFSRNVEYIKLGFEYYCYIYAAPY